jgi:23S rRNA pseudouridine2605 synthase
MNAPGERIAKVIARAGLCSRREAERLIEARRVAVDGDTIDSPALNVTPDQIITVDGEAIAKKQRAKLWRYHKPRGLLVAERDTHGRPTIYDHLPPNLPRVMPVGRLDLTSEGLLLLTNDGAVKRHLELPATGWLRRYRVRVFGDPDRDALAALKLGAKIEGVTYGPIEATIDHKGAGRNAWLTVALREGKNREVRRVLGYLGLTVNRLIRVAYGPFQLGLLDEGMVEAVPERVLRDQLGALVTDQ